MTLNEAINKISDEARSLGYSEKQIHDLTPDAREMLYAYEDLTDAVVDLFIGEHL